MHILKRLYLKDFRNYKSECFEFSPQLNAIIGKNAQGKTNLLEAIYLLMTGRSFRTSNLSDLPYFGCSSFYLEAHFEKAGIEQTLKMTYHEKERIIILNQTPIPTLSSLFGIILGVIITPEDRALIVGPPLQRRQFLNLHIARTNPFYLHHFRRYEKALKQRNTLLRQKRSHSIEVWEEQMAISGAYLIQERVREAEELEKKSHEIQKLLSFDKEELTLKYKSSLSSKEIFQEMLAKTRNKDLLLGYTSIGPHKEDLSIVLDGKEARSFASEGQKRGIITALRMAEWQLLKDKTEDFPIFCIDDMGIFLDKKREEILLSLLPSLGQVFLTSPRSLPELNPSPHLLTISQGRIFRQTP